MDAGHGLRARLAAMGLVPGVEVLMVKNEGGGAKFLPTAAMAAGTEETGETAGEMPST